MNQSQVPQHQIHQAASSRQLNIVLCVLGVLVVLASITVTTYMLHDGSAILAFFNRSMSLLANADGSPDSSSAGTPSLPAHLLKHELKKSNADKTCRSDVCIWMEDYLRGKLNESVDPCHDFYAYVCSQRWFAKDLRVQDSVYQERTTGMMMYDIEKFLEDYRKHNKERYHMYPGVFLHQAISLLPKCQSEEKEDVNMTALKRLLEEYNLGGWPYRKVPRGLNVVTVSAFVDRDLGVFSFARTYLKRLFEGDRGYTIHLGRPSSTLKRHQLAFLNENVENYTQKVALALTLIDRHFDVTELAEAIVLLEKKLVAAMPVAKFVTFQDLMMRVDELNLKGKWDWKKYLNIIFHDIESFDNDKPVAIMDHQYVTQMAAIVNETDTVTLLNYIGYRLLVHVSPILVKAASPLLRLSHDNHREFVPDRLQACMHLLERVYKQGMRFFARMTFSKNNSTLLLKHYDHSMSKVEVQLKSSITDRLLSTSSWLDRAAIGVGVDKLESMKLIFLGSTDAINTIVSYYNFNAQPLDPDRLLESFRDLQTGTMNTYWETKPPKDDLDARYELSSLSPGFEYFHGRNVLFLPHANIAFLNDVTRTIDPVLYPILLADVLRGMFAAIDRRGSTVDQSLAVASWWNADELSRFSKIELCFQDQYYVEIRDLLGDHLDAEIRLDESIADNAVLAPLHDLYLKTLTVQGLFPDKLKLPLDTGDMDMHRLFFVTYALGLCDNPSRELAIRKVKYGVIPGRLRINVPLMNFAKFSAAFNCPVGSAMNPQRKCTVW
ncbi:hypothetical protein HPB47_013136 [Ixodes persulcatus]|uniref:Uncharacterized protein n=1 Tax=Ixodes persulcatus TaxID=34615 RepID=A0AC60NRL6_IXOPE|nr:hypothetical protein HPB47_013136 [Ixodes persulcatus]